jgi:hypothetical protein
MVAERRTEVGYTEKRPAREMTPEGWVRGSEDYSLRRI